MGFPTEFQFTHQTYTPTSIDFGKLRANNGEILTNLKIYVNNSDKFTAKVNNIYDNDAMTFCKDIESKRWLSSCDMAFYQNQLKFATFCASSDVGYLMVIIYYQIKFHKLLNHSSDFTCTTKLVRY